MAGLVDSICTIITVFHKYADRRSECSSMKRRQMKRLIQKEFGDILENPRDPQIVKLTFQLLDVNGDNRVDFNEFLFLIFEMATACYSIWHPRECFSYSEERRRAVRDEEPHGNEGNRREFLEEDRRRDDVRERRGADRTPLQSTEEGRRGELSSELQEEVDHHFEGHDRELRDGDRRDRPSQERQEREPKQRRLEPKEREDIEIPEPRQRRQRESELEEDSPRQSRERVRRNDNDRCEVRGLLDRDEEDLYSPIVISRREDGRQRQGQETEHQEADGRLFRHGSQARVDRADYNVERSRPSHERREREDGRRELEMRSERRSRAFEPRVADERQDRTRHRSPVEEYEEHRPLSREGERRSQFHDQRGSEGRRQERRDGEDGRRELEMHSERRSRALVEPRVADVRRDRIRHRSPVEEYEDHRPLSREGERRSQFHEDVQRESEGRRQVFQSREDVRRAIRAEEEEVRRSERRRVEDELSTQRPRVASRRPEAESLERREQERRRPYSSELENMDRPSRSHESEGREGVRRSQRPQDVERRRREFSREETRATESIRRRPQSQEPEPRDPKYGRSQSFEEPRRDNQRRPRNYEVQSQERDAERRRRLQPRELVEREDNQEGQRYERESRDRERDGRRAMSLEAETRDEDRRRPQESASRYGERERLPEGDDRMRGTGRDMASPSDAGRRELDPSSPQQMSRRRVPEVRRSEPRSLKPDTMG